MNLAIKIVKTTLFSCRWNWLHIIVPPSADTVIMATLLLSFLVYLLSMVKLAGAEPVPTKEKCSPLLIFIPCIELYVPLWKYCTAYYIIPSARYCTLHCSEINCSARKTLLTFEKIYKTAIRHVRARS